MEIKFRGYSKSFNIMFDYNMLEMASAEMVEICNSKLKTKVPESIDIQMGLFLPTKDKDLELMQYTGFKDIEDKEIVEGDIVKKADGGIGVIKKGRYSITDPEGTNHIGFYIKWKNEAYVRVDLGYWLDKIRVIGNIYENKKLMEE